jgi:hypothetical protein
MLDAAGMKAPFMWRMLPKLLKSDVIGYNQQVSIGLFIVVIAILS